MSFPRYSKYKDSGVEWLGEVPKDWEVKPVRSFASRTPRSFIDGDWIETPYITDDGVRLIQTGNLSVGKYRDQGFRYISDETFSQLNCTEVLPGDILICRLADPVGRACLAPDLGCRSITSVDVSILKPSQEVCSQYLVYVMSSPEYLQYMDSVARGGTRQRVSRSFLGALRLPATQTSEQTQIARFLDHETARIDALIQEQQRLIELLKEKRQAVISHAVTKGLDPTVPIKDSGVEWLGKVPAHWEVKKMKFVGKICYGIGEPPQYQDSGTPLIRATNVDQGGNANRHGICKSC